MKTVAIMQPYLFPYIGYMQLMKACDEFVIYDDVNHIVRGWVNRNNILINGDKKLFTISLIGASSNKLINEIEIGDDFTNFEKTVAMAYAKAPYVQEVKDLIHTICSYPDKNLAKFIANSLAEISKYLGFERPIIFSSDIEKDSSLKGQDKIIEICKKLGAQRYVNPSGGVELYNKANFEAEGMDLKFIKNQLPEYKQSNNDFIPGLSIIDVMMFNSPEEVNKMLDLYELV